VQSAAIEAALGDAGIPFQLRGATRFFELREVKEALMLLRGAALTATTDPLFKTVSDVLRSLGWMQDQPEARGAVRDRWESLNAIMGLAEAAPAGTTIRAFVDELFERQTSQHDPERSAVTLASLHAAKGLEWESVHIIGLSEGLVPISYARGADAIEEERRLLYVGITRARARLSLSWAERQRDAGSQRQQSRFLAELTGGAQRR
jgi:DNA helicase II / ATP-dependent DNA helicase PcrA